MADLALHARGSLNVGESAEARESSVSSLSWSALFRQAIWRPSAAESGIIYPPRDIVADQLDQSRRAKAQQRDAQGDAES
jgi:hypothetical protein